MSNVVILLLRWTYMNYVVRSAFQANNRSASSGGQNLAEFGPDLAISKPNLVAIDQSSWSNSCKIQSNLGQSCSIPANSVDAGPNVAVLKPSVVEFGPSLVEISPLSVDGGQTVIEFGGRTAKSGRTRAKDGRVRP